MPLVDGTDMIHSNVLPKFSEIHYAKHHVIMCIPNQQELGVPSFDEHLRLALNFVVVVTLLDGRSRSSTGRY